MNLKFRAWDGKEMQYQFKVYSADGTISRQGVIREGWKVMQYTGLKDRSGKEIFAGDIVEWWSCEFYNKDNHDEHDPECFLDGGPIEYHSEHGLWGVRQGENLFSFPYNRPVKVIGNIYENPDLI